MSYDVRFDYIRYVTATSNTLFLQRQLQGAECQAKATKLLRLFVPQAVKSMVSEPRPQ